MLSLPALVAHLPADGPFDLITGIPVHPLVVHAVVVLLPLSCLALIAIVLVPRWRGAFGWVTMAGLAIGTASAFIAKESGEQLAERVGLPQQHSDFGSRLPLAAAVLFVVAAVWFLLQRSAARKAAAQGTPAQTTVLIRILGIVAIVLALGTTALTVATGHTGATAVWDGRIPSSSPTDVTPAPTAPATDAPATDAATGLTMAEVAVHATAADCWTVVNDVVYDLTAWIAQHPGGPEVITALCGTDGTAAFLTQHDGQSEPAKELQGFEVGPLATATALSSGATITPVAFAAPRADKKYTMAQVRKHKKPTDCWAAVNGSVYNLTKWINQHPGGASRIIALCGTNASAAFNAQHGSASNVAAILKGFRIGTLA